jgi:hypothetical protein
MLSTGGGDDTREVVTGAVASTVVFVVMGAVASTVVFVGASSVGFSSGGGVLLPERLLRIVPEAAGRVTDVTVLPFVSSIGEGSLMVWVGSLASFTSAVPPVKSRRNRPFQA